MRMMLWMHVAGCRKVRWCFCLMLSRRGRPCSSDFKSIGMGKEKNFQPRSDSKGIGGLAASVKPCCLDVSQGCVDEQLLKFYLIVFGGAFLSQAGTAVFFRWDISVIFCWDSLVICLTVVLKLAMTVLFILYFQTFRPKWLNFFRSFQKRFGLGPKNDRKEKPRNRIMKMLPGLRIF